MTTPSKRLENIMSDLMMICIESKKNLTMEKKLVNKDKAVLLVGEATELIEQMETEISKLDGSHVHPSQNYNLDRLVELLANNSNFDETLYVAGQLKNISSGIASTVDVIDNIEDEVIYEEQEIDDFK